jgi:capsular polysaccharide biosynthesis protein
VHFHDANPWSPVPAAAPTALLKAIVELKMPKAGTVQVLEDAEANPVPVRPNKKLNIGLGLGLGCFRCRTHVDAIMMLNEPA